MTCVLSLIWTGIAWGFMTGPGIIITVPNWLLTTKPSHCHACGTRLQGQLQLTDDKNCMGAILLSFFGLGVCGQLFDWDSKSPGALAAVCF